VTEDAASPRARADGAGQAPAAGADQPGPTAGEEGRHRSTSYGCLPILTGFLLLLVVAHRRDVWGYIWQGVFFVVVGISAYLTLSPRELAAARRADPGRTWWGHLLQMGVGLVVLPLLGWVLVVPVRWDPGFLVPVVPWVLLVAVAYAATAIRQRRPS